jgi:hypothetical protein
MKSILTSTGATSTNVAGYFSATGAANNYGLIVEHGNVGIGTASPTTNLEVSGALRLSSTSTDSFITPVGTSVQTKINIPYYDPGSFGQILMAGLPSTASASARAMTLVDARTTAHQPTMAILTPDETNIMGFSFDGSNTTGYVKSTVGLGFIVNGNTESIHVATTGNVGIGTTAPTVPLEVNGRINSAGPIVITTSGAGRNFRSQDGDATIAGYDFITNANGLGMFRAGTDILGFTTTSVERLRIDASGNVGIGTTTPSGTLSVNPRQYATGTASQALTTVTGVGTTFTSAMVGSHLVFVNGVSAGRITVFNSATSLTVTTSQTVASQAYTISYSGLNVTSTGKVGIGTTSPVSPLTVEASPGNVVWNALTLQNQNFGGNHSNIIFRDGWDQVVAGIGSLYDGTSNRVDFHSMYYGGVKTDSDIVMSILGTGNVGIGITNPSDPLTISRSGVGARTRLRLEVTGSATDQDSLITFADTGEAKYWSIGAKDTNDVFNISNSTDLGTTERFTVGSTGNVGIGNTGPSYKLDVTGDINTTTGLRVAATQVCWNTGCTAISDARLKEKIQPLENSLDNILKLRGVNYFWIDKGRFGPKQQVGLIAQEVEKIYPEVIQTDEKTGTKSVAYDHLVAPLIEAVKLINARLNELYRSFTKTSTEQSQGIASLAAKAAKLEAENLQLKTRADKAEKENSEIKTRLDRLEKALTSKP